MSKFIAVSIGDIDGIGIDILLKLLINNKLKKIVLFCDFKIISNYIKKNKYKIKLNKIDKININTNFKNNFLNIYSYKSKSTEDNSIKSIIFGHKECIKNNFIGLVTLPLNKDKIKKIRPNFIGHTEFIQKLEKKNYSNMIMFHNKIIASPITTHIKLKLVSQKLKSDLLFNQIFNLHTSLVKDFNIKKPKIIISGINPHSGENGSIGKEEIEIIKPVIKRLKNLKLFVSGPFSADSMLIRSNLKNFDCFVFMFHDQALIPFKYISKFSGVNYTGNLNIIRTSPDHGTAYNLKYSNEVSNKSLINCFSLIRKIFNNRKEYEKSKKISKSKFFN